MCCFIWCARRAHPCLLFPPENTPARMVVSLLWQRRLSNRQITNPPLLGDVERFAVFNRKAFEIRVRLRYHICRYTVRKDPDRCSPMRQIHNIETDYETTPGAWNPGCHPWMRCRKLQTGKTGESLSAASLFPL